jgi:hypothetical protein
LELRAAHDGRKVQDVAADLLAEALSADRGTNATNPAFVPKSLPLIKVRPATSPSGPPLTGQQFADFVKNVEQEQEIERYENAFGHQYVDRADS